jgi:hydrogenase maturation protease HycI
MNKDWKARLAAEIRGAQRVVLLGVGNPDRGDDGAGPLCARMAAEKLGSGAAERALVLDGREVPESLTGTIRKFAPDLTIVVDSAAGGHEPGTIFLVERDKIADEGISTHHISLLHLVRYLQDSIGSRVLVVGIEPRLMQDGAPMSPAVAGAAERLADFLAATLLP